MLISRRNVLKSSIAGAAAYSLPSMAKAAPPDLSKSVLRVAVWGGAHQRNMHNALWPMYEKTGGKVEYVFGNPRDHLPKMLAARGRAAPFDIVMLDDAAQTQAVQLDLLDKLDPANIPNINDIYPQAIPNAGYGPAKNTVSTGIGYNTNKYKELGLPAPKTWADLFNPKLAGRVAIPDLSVVMGPYTLVGLAELAGGDQSHIEPGFRKLKELNALYYYQSSSDVETKFSSGDVWAAAWVNGRAWALQKAGQPIGFSDPIMGDRVGMVGFNMADIVKGARNKRAAEYYINLLLDPQVQLSFTRSMYYGPTNRLTSNAVGADPTLANKFPYRPDDFKKMFVMDWTIVNPQMPKWVDEWNRTVR